MRVAQFLDQSAKGDLSFADEMFTDDVGFYWGTRESSFSEEEWREGMTAQHSVFKDITLKSGHMQSKRTSVATNCWWHTRASFRSMRTHRSR